MQIASNETSPIRFTNAEPGEHGISIRARTSRGVDGAPWEYAWSVDMEAPGTAFQRTPPESTHLSSAMFFAWASEPTFQFEFKLTDRDHTIDEWVTLWPPHGVGVTSHGLTFEYFYTDLDGQASTTTSTSTATTTTTATTATFAGTTTTNSDGAAGGGDKDRRVELHLNPLCNGPHRVEFRA
eukprot:CAMPEP_0182587276 /NCGR_PEP_ID=MMETSP1324-20130603/64669_1 /TAXON_ID=236786 /ORGANISM="Florenciella sp., Strain RCC1587" /LENGTH=181 /DNA_ID=CAMNT_0024804253 /DNA_START=1 /DNA_END=542 /DNA_ORIENTATION=+